MMKKCGWSENENKVYKQVKGPKFFLLNLSTLLWSIIKKSSNEFSLLLGRKKTWTRMKNLYFDGITVSDDIQLAEAMNILRL